MMNLRKADTKCARTLYSAIIIIVAVGAPLYLISGNEGFNPEINVKTILISVLYFIFVIGIIFLVFNRKGFNVTSIETDKRISSALITIRNTLVPIIILFILVQVVRLIYFLVSKTNA